RLRDHGTGRLRDLLVPSRVGVVAVAREIVRLVVRVVRALEGGAKVDVRRAGLLRGRFDDRVHLVGDLLCGVHVRIPLGCGVLPAQPDAPVVEQHDEGFVTGGELAGAAHDLDQVLLDAGDARLVAGNRGTARFRVGDVVCPYFDLDHIRGADVVDHL